MNRKTIFTLIWILIFSTPVFSQSSAPWSERAKKREGSRWTLSEWLAQKERNRMMDLWLTMNSPSPFEFSLGLLNDFYKQSRPEPEFQETAYQAEFQAYAKIFGLSVDYEKRSHASENDLSGALNLRLWGDSLQSSSLTISYGQRTRGFTGLSTPVTLRNEFYQGQMQMYLGRYFGIQGLYRQYQPATDTYLGTVGGFYRHYGLFLEFEFLRVYGAVYDDFQSKDPNGPPTGFEIQRNGIKTGLIFYY